MQRVLIAVVLILTAGLATWFWQQQSDPVLPVTIKPKPVTPAEPALSPIQKAAPVLDLKGEPIAPQDQAKAIAHIETITPPEKTPINVGKAQHFVTADQLLELPIKQIQTDAALEALAEAERADTTAVESVLQTLAPSVTGTATATTNQPASPPPLPGQPALTTKPDTEQPPQDTGNTITINIPGTMDEPESTSAIVTTTATPAPVAAVASAVSDVGLTVKPLNNTPQSISAQPLLVESSAILPREGSQIKLKELLDHPENSHKQIYYLHAVRQNDDQGLWGIIQAALVDAFARGLVLPGAQGQAQADIPDDADERLQDLRSSFLGHILQRKVQETYIYNYAKGNLGQNPDLIQPGQQLIIVTFTEEELIQIYQFFANP